MNTNTRTHLTTWTRRVLATTLAAALTLATLAGLVLAGAVVNGRSIHQAPPSGSGRAAATSLQHSERRQETNRPDTKHGRRLVVAFVAGTHGTIASDLLAPYDIFASSPAFTTYVVADASDPGTPRRRTGRRPDAHVRRRRRRPRPEARPGRRARPHQAHRRSRSAAARPGWPASTTNGAKSPRRVQRLDGPRCHRDARRARRHQPLVTHQRPGEEPPGRALDAWPSLRRGRVGDHHGSRHLRCPGRTAPGRRARRTRRGATSREPPPGARLDPDRERPPFPLTTSPSATGPSGSTS